MKRGADVGLFMEALNPEEAMESNRADLSNPMFQKLLQAAPPEIVHRKLSAMADDMGHAAFAQWIAKETVERTQPHKAIPETYSHYRSLVRDGIAFFLSCISCRRLLNLAVEQLAMNPATDNEARLLVLAKRFPTLHKLGQIIARHPDIDPRVKKWLIRLENGRYGTPGEGLLAQIRDRLVRTRGSDRIDIQPAILAEASVGAVIPFQWTRGDNAEPVRGVFKVLKPDIREHLHEELAILEKTAAFFEANRARYPLKDFKFLEVFQSVRTMLIKEIDLAAEQTHLAEAARFYDDMDGVCIPQCLPFGSDVMTAMAFLDGPKITDADLDPEQRRQLAATMFEALICRPLFSRREPVLFHGDPHAGNILAVTDPSSGEIRIGLLDWSLAGRLAKRDRVRTVRLIQAIFRKDPSGICTAVLALARAPSRDASLARSQLRAVVLGLMRSRGFQRTTLIKKTFRLLEALSHEGLVFPADLMLFRKAIFTLDGVLNDLWPSFDMDAAVIQYLTVLMAQEIPMRFGNLLFPLSDRPENYPSLISNAELHSLMVHQFAAAMRSGTRMWVDAVMGWGRVAGIPFEPIY
jgi:ubiquinone biosynthesis protein